MSPSKAPANDTSAEDSFSQICTIRIELLDTDPPIWREVEVPTSITLKVLHDIVQITMGWLASICGSSRSAAGPTGCPWTRTGERLRAPKP